MACRILSRCDARTTSGVSLCRPRGRGRNSVIFRLTIKDTCVSYHRRRRSPMDSGGDSTSITDRRRWARRHVYAAALLVVAVVASTAFGAMCPTAPDPAALPDAAALADMNAFVARLGVRPTGSRAHARYVDWIRRRLQEIPGVALSELDFPIDRWSARRAKLVVSAGDTRVRLTPAGPIPYCAPTDPRGVAAPLALVPIGTPITA